MGFIIASTPSLFCHMTAKHCHCLYVSLLTPSSREVYDKKIRTSHATPNWLETSMKFTAKELATPICTRSNSHLFLFWGQYNGFSWNLVLRMWCPMTGKGYVTLKAVSKESQGGGSEIKTLCWELHVPRTVQF